MTRADITSQAALNLREGLGTAADSDPFSLDKYATAIANELASRFDCLFGSASTDLVAGQTDYCAPGMKKILGVYVTDSLGNIRGMRSTTRRGLDRAYGAYWWRNAPTADPPRDAAFEGGDSVRLYPAPSIARVGALTVEGYLVPGEIWSNQADECPLPYWAHGAVVAGVCEMRAVQLVGEMPSAAQRAAFWGERYKKLSGDVDQMSAQYAPRESLFLPGWKF